MPKTKLRAQSTSGNYETSLAVAQSLNRGDRVRHRVTGKLGVFQEINLGYALPEVWVQFDSDNEIVIPTSCNPLDLELVSSESKQPEEMLLMSESDSSDAETISVPAVQVLEELTEAEIAELHRLEFKVERAFYEAGTALRELRDKRLYRSTHRTFEEYCQDRFGFHRRHSYQLIDAATVVENLCAISAQKNLDDSSAQILPTHEYQIRPLTKLEPVEQVVAWQQAVEETGGKVPTGRTVKGIVERLKEKPLVRATDFCSTGDVFTLIRLEGAERKYNGCWAIASDVKDFTLDVDVYDRTLTVKPENLKQIDEPDVRRQLPQTLKRIRRLRNAGLLDRGAYYVLEGLGRQIYLTELEEKLLSFLEKEYGIES